ncbi:FemAB family XrtA/PEP-CTERM system-associated protein [Calycomorphotria hydatis]|uniref:FemAB family protein n=1 Tax=Calycomorphotria hydatis TaxID=2528027 RepID=A0A517T4K1_9PLAN|nr:FemAB family XrtA/PEP-CTERM system-associated protein [Calycomorphotria hydatis]QDT63300.1 FemAB family protein [Calycomorphotria hydatis]
MSNSFSTASEEMTSSPPEVSTMHVQCWEGRELSSGIDKYADQLTGTSHPGRDTRWLPVLQDGLQQRTLLLVVEEDDRLSGWLPLGLVSGPVFGRFLISLPYINRAGLECDRPDVGDALVAEAVRLSRQWGCKYLQLRQDAEHPHDSLTTVDSGKLHMCRSLPATTDELWKDLGCKVRNQIRKGEKGGFTVHWDGAELLKDFQSLFSRTMHELGTPTFGRSLFAAILKHFGDDAELCVMRAGVEPVAAAILVHGHGITEVPSAASPRRFRSSNVNMLLYRHLLERAITRGQHTFDFGRCTRDGGPFRFKKQWGAQPEPMVWQYHFPGGAAESDSMRPDSSRNQKLIAIWKRLPLALTRIAGPMIVRGIP